MPPVWIKTLRGVPPAKGACPDEPPVWCSPLDSNYPSLPPVKFFKNQRDKQRKIQSSCIKKVQFKHSPVKYYFKELRFHPTRIILDGREPNIVRLWGIPSGKGAPSRGAYEPLPP